MPHASQSALWEPHLPCPRPVDLTSGELAWSDSRSRLHPRQLCGNIPGLHLRLVLIKAFLVDHELALCTSVRPPTHLDISPQGHQHSVQKTFLLSPHALFLVSLHFTLRQNICGSCSDPKNAGRAGTSTRMMAGDDAPGSRPQLCCQLMIKC